MAVLERYVNGARERFTLDDGLKEVYVGKSSERDLVLDGDPAVSRLHARFEFMSGRWGIEDLDSTNGTFVNGERITSLRLLRDGDGLRLGQTDLTYRDPAAREPGPTTAPIRPAPSVTKAEKRVLIELCRPFMSGRAFRPPARTKQVAEALFVTEAAVRQHLDHLYDKFDVPIEGAEPRRVRLANEAMDRGAISPRDLEDPPDFG